MQQILVLALVMLRPFDRLNLLPHGPGVQSASREVTLRLLAPLQLRQRKFYSVISLLLNLKCEVNADYSAFTRTS